MFVSECSENKIQIGTNKNKNNVNQQPFNSAKFTEGKKNWENP